MALRKASSYSKKKVRPYTRTSGKKAKAFIKTVPPNRIVKFAMGNAQAEHQGKLTHVLRLLSEEKVQVRDNALESCRLLINKTLDKSSQGSYYFVVKVYPHHILRENKTAAGAGADRLSSGMKHSFGVTVGRAAIVYKGTELFYISCLDEKTARIARAALIKVKSKVPSRTKVIYEKK